MVLVLTPEEIVTQVLELQASLEKADVGALGQTYLDQAQEALTQARLLIAMADAV